MSYEIFRKRNGKNECLTLVADDEETARKILVEHGHDPDNYDILPHAIREWPMKWRLDEEKEEEHYEANPMFELSYELVAVLQRAFPGVFGAADREARKIVKKFLAEKLYAVLLSADSELSAIGHHRPADLALCKHLSSQLEELCK